MSKRNTLGEQAQVHSVANQVGDGRLSAPSALRNCDAITAALARFAPDTGQALEIASGTGQHVVAYGRKFPAITWQPTDIVPERLASIDAWVAADMAADMGGNLRPARVLDAGQAEWDIGRFDLVVTSNLLHLISTGAAENVIKGAARALRPGGVLFVYGPFRAGGAFRSASDADFHRQITAADATAGYKSCEWMQETAGLSGLSHLAKIEMPANNLSLVWRKSAGPR